MLLDELGLLNMASFITDGAYNERNPSSNSTQDYEGNFYDPTEPVNESGYMETDISQPEYSIREKNDDSPYFTDYEIEHGHREEPTIKEKHYAFIKENFDFLQKS